MKQVLLMIAVVALVGCGATPVETSGPTSQALTKEESAKVLDAAIREAFKKKFVFFTLPPLGDLTKADYEKVTALNLDQNQLTELPKGLENLTKLRTLRLSNNQLTDVKGLEKLTQLEKLYLTGNKLTSVKGLEKLTKLEELWLPLNQLTDVNGLEKLTKLAVLSLGGNQLTDVKGLEKLTQLKLLWLTRNPDLTKAQIDELQKALQNCKIYR